MNDNVKWKKDNPKVAWSSFTGYDDEGNKYRMPANEETVTCYMKNGDVGTGWTAEGALKMAKLSKRLAREFKQRALKEMCKRRRK